MIECRVKTINGYITEYAHESNSFDFWANIPIIQEERGKYIPIVGVFDIETSRNPNEKQTSYMYHWQFAIADVVVFGRTWYEWKIFIERLELYLELTSKRKLVIFAHNLSFEFQYMKMFTPIEKVFAMDKRKILTVKTRALEYRCSYLLSNMSLQKFLENAKKPYYIKDSDDLDHNIVRTSETVLTPTENGYCYTDVKGLLYRINELLEEDTIDKLPLTSTGFVRRDARNEYRKNRDNRKRFERTALTENLYRLFRDGFRGGNVASNRYLFNMILEYVKSFDIASSYPFVMLLKEFPRGRFIFGAIDNEHDLETYNNRYCTIGKYLIKNPKVKKGIPFPYLAVSKSERLGKHTHFNGRILDAEYVETIMTNIDYEIFKNQYDYDSIAVNDFHFAQKGYLPKELRDLLLSYFHAKTTLKNVEGKEYEYGKSKNRINALFGMMVTSIDRESYDYCEESGMIMESDEIELIDQLEKYYRSRNSFLSYQDGVYITALARRQLQKAVDIIGLDVAYIDTDSVKYIGDYDHVFEQLNNDIIQHCIDNDIDHHIEHGGKKTYLGVWEHDGDYRTFKTLGAKKYAYTYEKGGKEELGITIAGVDKKRGAQELKRKGGLKKLEIGFTFTEINKLRVVYDETKPREIIVDGVTMLTGSCAHMEHADYTVGISDTMLQICEDLQESENLLDIIVNS